RRVGLTQRSPARRAVLVIALELFPVLVLRPIAGLLVRPELVESAALGLLGKVKPEFQNERAFIREHSFKASTLRERREKLGLRPFPQDSFIDRVQIPGAQEDPDLPSRRQ